LRVTLLHNPTAGDAQHSSERLGAVIAAAGHDVAYRLLGDDDWDSALGGDLVVVAGGDGAVRKVFRKLSGASIVATVLPIGTANNIARTLGFTTDDPARLVRGWASGTVRPFDVGEAESPWGGVRFVESLGGGIFAEMLVRAERGESAAADDKIDRGLRLLSDVVGEAPASAWSLELDGADLSGDYLAVEAMNVREAGPNVLLAPAADPGDGLLDVVLIGPEHRAALAAYVEERLRGRSPEPPRFEVQRGRRLVLRAPTEAPLHADDELWTERRPARSGGDAVANAGRLRIDVLLPSPS
jgi:diacylglycerol kinase (ATP)